MLSCLQIRLDESQELEARQLKETLQHELEMLIAFQSKIRMQTESQRTRERKELEDRVTMRRIMLEQKVSLIISFIRNHHMNTNLLSLKQTETEKKQFQDERNERHRLLVERQGQEMQTFDEESARQGFDVMAIAEASCESSVGDETSVTGSMLSLAHSNSNSSFTHAAL